MRYSCSLYAFFALLSIFPTHDTHTHQDPKYTQRERCRRCTGRMWGTWRMRNNEQRDWGESRTRCGSKCTGTILALLA
ncbi:hypothetical protein B0H16DRAFT_1543713 [Mycena metata]|uniref:Secreted protein n=1 Tax=Mycena metata TaxID=1033252 RepID=A0AAD7NBD1_9AGAR|nr:hypothetical protein B0H16DRAFT_1543713 [Mycena metata]